MLDELEVVVCNLAISISGFFQFSDLLQNLKDRLNARVEKI